MAMKFVVSAEEFGKLSPEMQLQYEKVGDVYNLITEGKNPLALKIDEFRQTNVKLMKDIKEAQEALSKWEGVDPEKAKKALEELQKLQDKRLIEEGKVEELLSSRTQRMQADHQNQIANFQKKIAETETNNLNLKNQLAGVTIDKEIQLAITQNLEAQPGAMSDILSRGRRIFQIADDGKVLAKDDKGNTLFGKDGVTPMTIQEWAASLPTEAPHLFKPAKGAGAPGSSGVHPGVQGKQVLVTNDPILMGQNLEKIAKGEVIIQAPA